MKRYYYDLHIHSCLSPCGDDDNTPNNIAGMAKLNGLDIVALTDHNTTKNCPAFFNAAKHYGIVPVAGMELTTSEDIHVVCLFESLTDATEFDKFIESKRTLIKNRPDIFGNQLILDNEDNVIGNEEFLLSNATSISIDAVTETVNRYNGICYPAHIDRDSNGIVAVLGTIPTDLHFSAFEIHSKEKIDALCDRFSINKENVIVSSDAHYLTDISEADSFLLLPDADNEHDELIRSELFKLLRGGCNERVVT